MAASTNDKFIKTGASTVTTLSAPGKALSATSITVGSTTNYPTDTGIVFAIRQVDVNGDLVAGTYTEWIGTVTSATTLSLLATPVYGSDQVYPAGSTTQVFMPLSSYAHNRMVDGLAVSLDQDGTLKAGAVDNPAVLATDSVTTAKIADANVTTAKINDAAVTPIKWTNPYKFRARRTSALTLANSTWTKMVFDTEDFDTNGNFATGTYTAPVAGYYHFDARCSAAHSTQLLIALYKNGSLYQRGSHDLSNGTSGVTYNDTVQAAQGDTFDIYAFNDAGGAVETTAGSQGYFAGYLVSQT